MKAGGSYLGSVLRGHCCLYNCTMSVIHITRQIAAESSALNLHL
uniref:Uncharacterized protein n=1 Tax=Anguilla anguilla TaxID=7936 RepID=A0A0E9PKG6_ANGAN